MCDISLDMFGYVWIGLDGFGIGLDRFRYVWKNWIGFDSFGKVLDRLG
jgi:hypothetical protein